MAAEDRHRIGIGLVTVVSFQLQHVGADLGESGCGINGCRITERNRAGAGDLRPGGRNRAGTCREAIIRYRAVQAHTRRQRARIIATGIDRRGGMAAEDRHRIGIGLVTVVSFQLQHVGADLGEPGCGINSCRIAERHRAGAGNL